MRLIPDVDMWKGEERLTNGEKDVTVELESDGFSYCETFIWRVVDNERIGFGPYLKDHDWELVCDDAGNTYEDMF